jgi:DNA-formamidopyrimidine glycosylase
VPELPEVETVRRGVDAAFRGGQISAVEVYNPRTVRRHATGIADFQASLKGLEITGTGRRGKFMWLSLDDGRALICHLGMSGQLHVVTDGREAHKHLRGRMTFTDERELWFIDQRTFGYWELSDMDGAVPKTVGHIAPDVFEAAFDASASADRLLKRTIEVKKALLDQGWVSGVGNIYADEALWRAPARPPHRRLAHPPQGPRTPRPRRGRPHRVPRGRRHLLRRALRRRPRRGRLLRPRTRRLRPRRPALQAVPNADRPRSHRRPLRALLPEVPEIATVGPLGHR